MNILQAFLLQEKQFNVVFTSVDYELLKHIIVDISKDFDNALFIDLFPIMSNIDDFDNERAQEVVNFDSPVKFIISPIYPPKYIKLKINYHINISLNNKIIEKRNINKIYINLEYQYKEQSMINKYINLSKYIKDDDINYNKLEDDIFDMLNNRIMKKLDNGSYIDKLNDNDAIINKGGKKNKGKIIKGIFYGKRNI